MAIAYDTDSTSTADGGGVTSITIPTFATSGSNRWCFAAAAAYLSVPTTPAVSSVVRGGSETFTPKWDVLHANNQHRSYGGFFTNPAEATASVVVTWASTVSGAVVGAFALTGVDQSTPTGTHGTATGTGTAVTVTVAAAADEWLIDSGWVATGAGFTIGADQTLRFSVQEDNWTGSIVGCSTQPGSADDIMSWTADGSMTWVIGAVPIKPVASGITVTQTSVISATASVPTPSAATLYPGSVIPTITL